MREQPNREDEVRVYVDTDLVKDWFSHKRSTALGRNGRPLDYPGKKHMVIFNDDDGTPLGHTWMTSEEKMKMRLEGKFRR